MADTALCGHSDQHMQHIDKITLTTIYSELYFRIIYQ